jgi:hypothetical protein
MTWGLGPWQGTGSDLAEMKIVLIIATTVTRDKLGLFKRELLTTEGFVKLNRNPIYINAYIFNSSSKMLPK